jgi:GT2 family glycosyltransferase
LQLSVIIVNYNVRFFLEQCLYAVQKAIRGIEAEVIVVDNNSADGSMAYLQPLFPGTRFIINTANLGFAKANNQALAQCSGEHVLFLNPDTLIPESCLHLCLAYLSAHPRAGALGLRMLDGKGRFLAESKRSFPSPLASFYKLTGLAALFPRSARFNEYALGELDENQDHEVPVLAGAFTLVEKALLDELKGFDESYFMYGEDIDLSFRIRAAGRQNHYFAGTSIIHFKGESSRRGSLAYVRFFYGAMMVFVQGHYPAGTAKWFSYFIRLAIALRATIAAIGRVLKPILLPLADGLIVWFFLKAVSLFWVSQLRHGKDFGVPFISYGLALFALMFIAAAAFAGL